MGSESDCPFAVSTDRFKANSDTSKSDWADYGHYGPLPTTIRIHKKFTGLWRKYYHRRIVYRMSIGANATLLKLGGSQYSDCKWQKT
jgi:hypothetical protein